MVVDARLFRGYSQARLAIFVRPDEGAMTVRWVATRQQNHARSAHSAAITRSSLHTREYYDGAREVHRQGDEAAWWRKLSLYPTPAARTLWLQTHPLGENKLGDVASAYCRLMRRPR